MKIKRSLAEIQLFINNNDAINLISLLNNLLDLKESFYLLCSLEDKKAVNAVSFYCSLSSDDNDYITLNKIKLELNISIDTIDLFIYKLNLFLETGHISPPELCEMTNRDGKGIYLSLINA